MLFSLNQWLFSEEPVAIISKLRGNVKHKIVSDNRYRSKTHLNTPIFSNSQIRTKDRAFSKVAYLDDGTVISIYPNTEVRIQGIVNNNMLLKQVDLINGIIRVNVMNQISGEFKLATPYSELRCNACNFWVTSEEFNGDQFIKVSGDAQVWNSSMDIKTELISDSTLISKEKMEFETFETPIENVKFLESLMLDADETSLQYKEDISVENTSATTTNIVVIKLKNAANVEREIIVTYTH